MRDPLAAIGRDTGDAEAEELLENWNVRPIPEIANAAASHIYDREMTDSPVRHEFRRNATVRRRSIKLRCQSISSHWRPINSPSRTHVGGRDGVESQAAARCSPFAAWFLLRFGLKPEAVPELV